MHGLPNFGDPVKVWPAPGLRVQDGAGAYGRIAAAEGREVSWDEYWHRRYLDGAILLHDPRPAPAPAAKKTKDKE